MRRIGGTLGVMYRRGGRNAFPFLLFMERMKPLRHPFGMPLPLLGELAGASPTERLYEGEPIGKQVK